MLYMHLADSFTAVSSSLPLLRSLPFHPYIPFLSFYLHLLPSFSPTTIFFFLFVLLLCSFLVPVNQSCRSYSGMQVLNVHPYRLINNSFSFSLPFLSLSTYPSSCHLFHPGFWITISFFFIFLSFFFLSFSSFSCPSLASPHLLNVIRFPVSSLGTNKNSNSNGRRIPASAVLNGHS